jgi:cytochrome c oxidase cbb3-type subunit III
MTETPQSKPPEDPATEPDLLDHEYDGIREYDNPLPGWWVWIFWASVHFSFAYFVWYHVLPNGTSVADAYASDMAEFREWLAMKDMGEKMTEDGLAALMTNESVMGDARGVFAARCAQCHAENGEGKIGPNLTDAFWLHGNGRLMDIYDVVHDGVPAKGMPAWSRQLTPMELGKVVAFVGTLRGKNLPGKAPEGREVSLAPLAPPAAAAASVAAAAPGEDPAPLAEGG